MFQNGPFLDHGFSKGSKTWLQKALNKPPLFYSIWPPRAAGKCVVFFGQISKADLDPFNNLLQGVSQWLPSKMISHFVWIFRFKNH